MANKVSTLTLQLVDEISKPARTVEEALKQAEAQVKAIAAEMGEGSGASDRLVNSLGKLGATKGDVEAVARAWTDYTKVQGLAAESSNWTKEQTASVRAWETQTIGAIRAVMKERTAETAGLRRAAAEQNEILQKSASEQAAIQRESARAQKESRHLAAGVAGGVGGGIVGAMIGGETIEALKESLGLGMTLDQRVAQLRGMGLSNDNIAASRAQFREYSKTHAGVSEAEWLKARGEASTIAPGDEAEMTEMSANYRAAARNTGVSVGEGDFKSIMRTMDLMGVKTTAERHKFLDDMIKIQQKYQGTVTPETYLSAVQNLRSAKFALSPDFMTKYFPTLLAAAGEQGGTEVMTAFNNYIGGHMTHSELQKLAADGFVNDSDLVRTKTGAIVGTKPGSKMFEESTFEKNPYQWSLDFHDTYMKRQGATEESFDKLVMSMPRNMGAMIQEFVHNKNTFDRDAANQGQAGLAASTNEWMAQNPAAGADALKTALEQLATSITAAGVQKLGPALAAAAQQVQTFAADIGGANQNMVALGGGVAAAVAGFAGLKALFGVGGSIFGGFGLSKSAGLLDASAEQLMAAARMLQGEGAHGALGGHGPGRSPSSLRGRAGLALGTALPLLAGAPSDDASIEAVLNDPSKSAASQNIADSIDALKRLANDALAAMRGHEIVRPAHPGRDVHSPSSGPYSYTPSVNTSAIDGAQTKVDALGQSHPTVVLGVDSSAVDTALSRIRSAISSLNSLVGGIGGPGPSLGSTMRGNFSHGGVNGE